MPTDRQPSPAPGPPPDPEAVRAVTRPVMWFSGLLLAGLWFSATAPPWPLPLLTGVLALAAIVLGIRGLVRMRRARIGGAMLVLVILGLLLAAAMVLISAMQAVMWPVYAELHACLDRAITVRAERACTAELEGNVQDWVWGLLGS
ncbi:hypothetical protein [Georgenia sunbinii]|uniref:hypothetical protein n=1 Tax=Georgenia sunbinii TaxID=3117728 RepID=UPI002F2687BA